MNIKDIDDKDLIAELTRRKKIKKAKAWNKLEKLKKEVYNVLYEHDMTGIHWSSITLTLEEEVEEMFDSLKGACGGNDIEKILKEI